MFSVTGNIAVLYNLLLLLLLLLLLSLLYAELKTVLFKIQMTVDESNVDIGKVWATGKSDPKFTNNRDCIKNTILKEKAIVFNNLYTGTYYTVTVVARTICKEDKASMILQTEIGLYLSCLLKHILPRRQAPQ
jgi:hypothetical protein